MTLDDIRWVTESDAQDCHQYPAVKTFSSTSGYWNNNSVTSKFAYHVLNSLLYRESNIQTMGVQCIFVIKLL